MESDRPAREYVRVSDLRTTAEAAEMLGLSSAKSITTYRDRFEDFPTPVIETPRLHLYHVDDLRAWMTQHGPSTAT